jgi:outer membrane protein assembly factor BamB
MVTPLSHLIVGVRSSLRALITALAVGAFCAIPSLPALATETRLVRSPEPDWPQFRGPYRDGISSERGLLSTWPEAGPKPVWSIDGIGRGFSSPVIVNDRIYITGDVGNELHVFTLDLGGKKLWQSANGAAWTGDYPGARASVAYRDGRIYHQNAHGRVVCLDAANGKPVWAVDLLATFHGKNITWALSECLLADDRAVYATAGGSDALMVALDLKTGSVLWKSPPLHDREDNAVESPSYVSPILVQFGGRRLLIGCSLRNLFCLDAADGKLQWTQRFPTSYSVLAMMPVLVDDAIFMTAPHGKGGHLLRLTAPASASTPVGVEEVWSTRLDTCQGGVVHVNGRLFGSYYGPRKGWAALDGKTGDVLYSAPDLIKGSVVHAEDRLYVLSEDGWMHLLEPAASQFVSKGRFQLADANAKRDAWAHPVIHQGRLYLRYHDKFSAFDIRAQ